MKTLQTKTTKLFNYFVLCFNRRKASGLCLWIQVLTTMLKNCFFLRLENTCFYIFNLDCFNYHQHPEPMQFYKYIPQALTLTHSLTDASFPCNAANIQLNLHTIKSLEKKILRLTSPFTFHHEFWSLCRNH